MIEHRSVMLKDIYMNHFYYSRTDTAAVEACLTIIKMYKYSTEILTCNSLHIKNRRLSAVFSSSSLLKWLLAKYFVYLLRPKNITLFLVFFMNEKRTWFCVWSDVLSDSIPWSNGNLVSLQLIKC